MRGVALRVLLLGTVAVVVAYLSIGDSSAQESRPAGPSAADSETLARLDGEAITIQDYQRHLLRELGSTRFDDFIDRRLLELEARERGVSLSYESIESELRKRERQIEGWFGGDAAALEASLERRGLTKTEYLRRLRDELLIERVSVELIRIAEASEVGGDGNVIPATFEPSEQQRRALLARLRRKYEFEKQAVDERIEHYLSQPRSGD